MWTQDNTQKMTVWNEWEWSNVSWSKFSNKKNIRKVFFCVVLFNFDACFFGVSGAECSGMSRRCRVTLICNTYSGSIGIFFGSRLKNTLGKPKKKKKHTTVYPGWLKWEWIWIDFFQLLLHFIQLLTWFTPQK